MKNHPPQWRLAPLAAGIGLALSTASASAITFTEFSNRSGNTDPNQLAAALLTPGGGINLIGDSADFLGNLDQTQEVDEYGGDFPEGDFGAPAAEGDSGFHGSASFFSGLDFGTVDGTSISLPDGVLLTSGVGTPPTENTLSNFSGLASGLGEGSLDAVLASVFGAAAQTTSDATALSFDFTVDAGINAVSLDFIFATDEFPDQGVTDIAGIFVDGVNYAGFPDGTPLMFRQGTPSAANFIDNNQTFDGEPGSTSPMPIEYDGVSRPLSFVGLLDPGRSVHSIKIAISDTSDTVFDSGLFVANVRGITISGGGGGAIGSSPNDPLLPPDDDDPDDGFDFVVNIGDTGFGIDPQFPIFIDPLVATGYTYTSSGSNFASVLLPVLGDNLYDLLVPNGLGGFDFLAQIMGGVTYNFLTDGGLAGGVDSFQVTGIETSLGLDPTDVQAFVTGVTFVAGGQFSVNQNPITTFVPAQVPEPDTLLLLGLAPLGLWAIRRRRA